MSSVPDVADGGCAKILELLLRFLVKSSRGSRAVVQAVVSLLVVLSMAYVAGVALPYLHLTDAAPASAMAACFVYLAQFVVLVFTPVLAWLILMAVQLAAFDFLGGRRYVRDWAGVQLERAGLNRP